MTAPIQRPSSARPRTCIDRSVMTLSTKRTLSSVLLYVYGTLIDSNDAHARSWSEAVREFGSDVPLEVVRPLIGMGGDKLLPRLLGVDAESDVGKAFSERRAEVFREQYVPHLRQTAGARELVRRFREE